MYNFSQGFSIEIWFIFQMQKLRMVDNTPIALATVVRVARQHLPSKTETAFEFIDDPDSVEELLDKIFKIDCILRVEQADGTIQRVAVDISSNPTKAQSKFNEIMQPNFWIARQELMIDRHWIVLVNAKKLPDEAKLIDAMYEAVDDQKKCVMIDLTKL